MRELMVKNLDDEYELGQLMPVEDVHDKSDDSTRYEYEDMVDDLPEAASAEMRAAIFEAVLDEVIEDAIDTAEQEGNNELTSSEIEERVEPLVDTAVELYLVPPSAKRSLNKLIARRLRVRNPQYRLVEKAAHFLANAVTRMEDENTVVEEVLDTKPADVGADITNEVVKPEQSDVAVEVDIPEPAAETLRFLVASEVNRRKATALVSKRISGRMLQDTLHRLRHHLPPSFKRKFNVK